MDFFFFLLFFNLLTNAINSDAVIIMRDIIIIIMLLTLPIISIIKNISKNEEKGQTDEIGSTSNKIHGDQVLVEPFVRKTFKKTNSQWSCLVHPCQNFVNLEISEKE